MFVFSLFFKFLLFGGGGLQKNVFPKHGQIDSQRSVSPLRVCINGVSAPGAHVDPLFHPSCFFHIVFFICYFQCCYLFCEGTSPGKSGSDLAFWFLLFFVFLVFIYSSSVDLSLCFPPRATGRWRRSNI